MPGSWTRRQAGFCAVGALIGSAIGTNLALAHMNLLSASGVTKVINLTTNMTFLTVYLINGKVLISLGLTAGVFSICGNYLGARYFKEGGSRAVKPLIVAVLVIFFLRIVYELWGQ